MERRIWLTCLMLALVRPVPSFAETALTVTPNGDNAVLLQGHDVKGMETVEISFGWNTTLGEPQVSVQGGNVAGIVPTGNGGMTIKVNRDDPDAVLDIEVGFENSGDMSRAIGNVSATARDAGGATYPLPVNFHTPEVPPLWEPPPVQIPPHDPSAKQNSGNDNRNPGEGSTPTGRISSRDDGPSAVAAEEQGRTPDVHGVGDAQMSILQRFREYRGEKGLREFSSLFASKDGGIRQEPAVAIADGKTPVRVFLEVAPSDGYAPNFALSDAKLVSLQKAGVTNWVLTVVPNKGVWEVKLFLWTGKEKRAFPLTVAPSVKVSDTVNEKNFLVEFNKYLTAQDDRRTLNSGPSLLYLYEYIFTANCLARSESTPPKKTLR